MCVQFLGTKRRLGLSKENKLSLDYPEKVGADAMRNDVYRPEDFVDKIERLFSLDSPVSFFKQKKRDKKRGKRIT